VADDLTALQRDVVVAISDSPRVAHCRAAQRLYEEQQGADLSAHQLALHHHDMIPDIKPIRKAGRAATRVRDGGAVT